MATASRGGLDDDGEAAPLLASGGRTPLAPSTNIRSLTRDDAINAPWQRPSRLVGVALLMVLGVTGATLLAGLQSQHPASVVDGRDLPAATPVRISARKRVGVEAPRGVAHAAKAAGLGTVVANCPRNTGVPREQDTPFGAASPTVLFGILSAKTLVDRRDMLRSSWIPLLAAWPCAAHVFLEGDPDAAEGASIQGDVLTLRVRDDYENLPQKVLAFFSAARHSGVDFAVKLDDRTFVNVDTFMRRLPPLVSTSYVCVQASPSTEFMTAMGKRVWHQDKCTEPAYNTWNYTGVYKARYCLGASGYVIGTHAMDVLDEYYLRTFTDEERSLEIYEDKLVGEVLYSSGVLSQQFDNGEGAGEPDYAYDVCKGYHKLVEPVEPGAGVIKARRDVQEQITADPVASVQYEKLPEGSEERENYARHYAIQYLRRECMTLIDPHPGAEEAFVRRIIYADRVDMMLGDPQTDFTAELYERAVLALGDLAGLPSPELSTTASLKPPLA